MSNEKDNVKNNGDETSNSPLEGESLVIALTFAQEVLISIMFLIGGFLLLVLTEPGGFTGAISPIIDVLLLLRALVNSILLLFIPGFALTNLLFMDSEKLDFIERIALSCGLSISLVILAGFLLAGGEITAISIYLFIAGFTVIFVLTKLAAIRLNNSEKFQSKLLEMKGSFNSRYRSKKI